MHEKGQATQIRTICFAIIRQPGRVIGARHKHPESRHIFESVQAREQFEPRYTKLEPLSCHGTNLAARYLTTAQITAIMENPYRYQLQPFLTVARFREDIHA